MFKEFNLVATLNKKVLIQCFQKDLWLSIQAQIHSLHQELNSLEKMLDKAMKIKYKTALQSGTSIREINACFQKSRRRNIKEKTSKTRKKNIRLCRLTISLILYQKQAPSLPIRIFVKSRAIVVMNGQVVQQLVLLSLM